MGESEKKSFKTDILIWTAILAVIGIAVAILSPVYRFPQKPAPSTTCINNLRQIDAAKQEWGIENKKSAADIPTWNDLKPYLGRGDGVLPKCPLGGIYTIGALSNSPTCSLGTTVNPPHVLEN